MNFSEFLRIERESRDGSRHYVLHLHDPKFSMELAPDATAPDKVGKGVIKRICVPNSWDLDSVNYYRLGHVNLNLPPRFCQEWLLPIQNLRRDGHGPPCLDPVVDEQDRAGLAVAQRGAYRARNGQRRPH